MTSEEIEKEFQEAYLKASSTSKKFPPDLMLKLYAYYKQATDHAKAYTPSGDNDVKSAFKLNALLQVKDLTPLEAKKAYIDLVNKNI
jgi:acyl-CoA-binding protein